MACPAQIGDPVPGEQTLHRDDQVGAVGRQRLEQELLVGRNLRLQHDGAGLIDNANRQKPGVQIDAAVQLVLLGVKAHHGLLGLGGA